MKNIRSVVLFLLVLMACGKRGDPRPPVPIVPQTTNDLLVTQRGSDLVLSWSYPSLTASGQKLEHFDRIIVYRYAETLPATATPNGLTAAQTSGVDASKPLEVQQFAAVPALSAAQFRKLREKTGILASADVPEHVAGATIVFRDQPPFHSAGGGPVRLNYAVATVSEGSESPLSNLISIVPLTVPSVPQNLSASADAKGVHLSWDAPAQRVAGSAGYDVYRFGSSGEIVSLGAPLNKTPVSETHYDDVPPFGQYRYLVTAVRSVGPPIAESEPTATVYAEFKDLAPPPTPAGVVTLAEQSAVRVVWDAVESGDLAGYKVYRARAGAKAELLTPSVIHEVTYRDTTLQRGVAYVYSVSSVDQLGNESSPAPAAEITIPNP